MQLGIHRPVSRPEPIAYAMGDGTHCCTLCMPHSEAQIIADTDVELGEVYPWTNDMEVGDPDFTCSQCGHVIAKAPVYGKDDE